MCVSVDLSSGSCKSLSLLLDSVRNKELCGRKVERNSVFACESCGVTFIFVWCSTQPWNLLFLAGPYQICGLVVPGNQKLRQTGSVITHMFPRHLLWVLHSQLLARAKGELLRAESALFPMWGPFRWFPVAHCFAVLFLFMCSFGSWSEIYCLWQTLFP